MPTDETPPQGAHLRIGAAARILGVSVDTLRRWDREGKLNPTRRNGQRVYTLAALDAAMCGPDDGEAA